MERELSTVDLDPAALIGGRYQLVRQLCRSEAGCLWSAEDQGSSGAPVALLQISQDQDLWRRNWLRLQGLLHPQLPRCAEAISLDDALWLPREWVEGEPYADLSLAEVVVLLKQLLPLLSVLHGQGLGCGALDSATVLRRSSDGLPVLLDLGASAAEEPAEELQRLAQLAVTCSAPGEVEALKQLEPWQRLAGVQERAPFASADAALQALRELELPTAQATPAPAPTSTSTPTSTSEASLPAVPRAVPRRRQQRKEQDVEGRIGPVVVALVVAAVVSTGLGWLLLSRGKVASPTATPSLSLPSRLPAAEVDQREQLLNRLRALQIDRRWFLKLVDASLMDQGGRLPGDGLEDAPLRKVWNEIAEDWLSRVEQLPLDLRVRLGSLTHGDWRRRQDALVKRGLSPTVVEQLVSGSAFTLLSERLGAEMPPEPFRQLWYAAAEQALSGVQIEWLEAKPGKTITVSSAVAAGGARVFPLKLPEGSRLVLGVNGSPLMQMSVFDAQGQVLEDRGPLRVVSLGSVSGSPVQVLVTNEGLSMAMLTLSLRADR
ncbi:MAG: serine/threonine protein kinase [Vulcanococcus sp.]